MMMLYGVPLTALYSIKRIVALFFNRTDIGHNFEIILCTIHGSQTSGYFRFYLDDSDCLFCHVVCKRYFEVLEK